MITSGPLKIVEIEQLCVQDKVIIIITHSDLPLLVVLIHYLVSAASSTAVITILPSRIGVVVAVVRAVLVMLVAGQGGLIELIQHILGQMSTLMPLLSGQSSSSFVRQLKQRQI